jgi:molecular chaperone GrpE (heat shock protein)
MITQALSNGEQKQQDSCSPKEKYTPDIKEPQPTGVENTVEELKNKLEHKQKETENYRESVLRALADFENCKKRAQKAYFEMKSNTFAEILENLLPI